MISSKDIDRSSQLQRPKRVLIISHWFPPVNVIGAVRVGKFAKFLHEAGYEVRVIAALDRSPDFADHSLPIEIPATSITYLESRIDEAPNRRLRMPSRFASRPPLKKGESNHGDRRIGGKAIWLPSSVREELTRHYYAFMRIPDARAGWIHSAVKAGMELVSRWRPDIIFASAPPNSSLVAAAKISRACGVPWVAELRDLWVGNPYNNYPLWRLWLDKLLEKSTLRDAAGLVSVTPLWTDSLRRRYKQPAISVLNGFVPEDFPQKASEFYPSEVVSIVYTGNIYSGFRDPSPVFDAINLLGAERDKVAIHFYGPAKEQVHSFKAAKAVTDRILIHSRVSYKESLALQSAADVLLLLQWANKKDEGNIPAKFFEYLGAGRPMLFLGYEHGTLAQLIRERGVGFVSNDPACIAAQLRRWIVERPRGIPGLNPSACADLTRHSQFRDLELFIDGMVSAYPLA